MCFKHRKLSFTVIILMTENVTQPGLIPKCITLKGGEIFSILFQCDFPLFNSTKCGSRGEKKLQRS